MVKIFRTACLFLLFVAFVSWELNAQVVKGESSAAIKKQRCWQMVVCVHSEEVAGTVKLFVENKRFFPVTVHLDLALDNMQAFYHQPIVSDYPGKSKTHVITLKPKSADKNATWSYAVNWQRGHLNIQHDNDYVYRLPYAVGRRFRVTQAFGGQWSHQNDNYYAIDIQMPQGTQVYAAREGVVVGIKENSNIGCGEPRCRDNGNYVAIRHSDGTLGEYFHLKFKGVLVEPGQQVKVGQLIALSGNTGWSNSAHLHFSVHSAISAKERRSHPFLLKTDWGVLQSPQYGKFYTSVK